MTTSDTAVGDVLLSAEAFYLDQIHCGWVPGYLVDRGLQRAEASRWRIGYAPAGWTTLTQHLHDLGYDNATIHAAGLARRSSRGTLIDHFRDRVMFPVRNERGSLVGFIGRARPARGRLSPSTSTAQRPSCTPRRPYCSAFMKHAASSPAVQRP